MTKNPAAYLALMVKAEHSEHIKDILVERVRQEVKWGRQDHHPLYWLAIIGEEYGEACKGWLDKDYDNFRKEVIETAACCLALLGSLDREKDASTRSEAKRDGESVSAGSPSA